MARRERRGNIIIEQNSQRTKNKPTGKVKQSGKGKVKVKQNREEKQPAKLRPLPPLAEDNIAIGI